STTRNSHARAHTPEVGGVIAANHTVTAEMAREISQVFTEVIIAPDFDDEAIEILTAKKNIRILRCPDAGNAGWESKAISGGVLYQDADRVDAPGDDPANWTLAAGQP